MVKLYSPLKTLHFLFLIALLFTARVNNSLAQAPIYFSSGHFSTPNNWTQSSSSLMTNVSGTYRHITTANSAGSSFFRAFSATSGGTRYEPSGPNDITLSLNTFTDLQTNGAFGKAYGINAANTSDNYVFIFRDKPGAPSTKQIRVLRIGGTIRTIQTVNRAVPIGGTTVYRGMPVTVSSELNGAKHADQGIYLRYTKDNYSTSTVVEMSLVSGNTYSATIPANFNTSGASVSYYIFSSNSGQTISAGDADGMTINLNNNSGSNYSYNVSSVFCTVTGTVNWSNTSSWYGGTIPSASDAAVIAGNVSLNAITDIANVSVLNGATLNKQSFGFNVGNAIQVNSGGTLNCGSGNFTTPSIICLSGGTINGNTATVNITGTTNAVTNAGTFNAGTSTFSFTGSGTKEVSSGLTFHNVTTSTGVRMGTSAGSCTVNGTLTINSGGFISSHAVNYGANSSLVYNTGDIYNRSHEWLATSSNPGYPNNVTLMAMVELRQQNSTDGGLQCGGILDLRSTSAIDLRGLTSKHIFKGGIVHAGLIRTQQDIETEGSISINTSGFQDYNSRYFIFTGNGNSTMNSSLSTIPTVGNIRINKQSGGSFGFAKQANINTIELLTGTFNMSAFPLTATNIIYTGGILQNSNPTNLSLTNLTYSGIISTTGAELTSGTVNHNIIISNNSEITLNRVITFSNSNLALSVGYGKLFIPNNNAKIQNGILRLDGHSQGGSSEYGIYFNNPAGMESLLDNSTFPPSSTNGLHFNTGGTFNFLGLNYGEADIFIYNNSIAVLNNPATVVQLFIEAGATFDCNGHNLALSAVGSSSNDVFVSNNGTFVAGPIVTITTRSNRYGQIMGSSQTVFNNLTQGGGKLTGSFRVDGVHTITTGGGPLLSLPSNRYGPNGELVYSVSGTHIASRELSGGGNASLAPKKVTVASGTVVFDDTYLNFNRNVPAFGDIQVNAGATLDLGARTEPLSVLGNLIVNGTINLGSNSNGHLVVIKDLVINSTGVINTGSRELIFSGANSQSLTPVGVTPTIGNLRVLKSNGALSIGGNINIGNGTNTGSLWVEQGTFQPSGYAITTSGTGAKTLGIMPNGVVNTDGTDLYNGGNWAYHNGTSAGALDGRINFTLNGLENIPPANYTGIIAFPNEGVKRLVGNSTLSGEMILQHNNAIFSRNGWNLALGNNSIMTYAGTGAKDIGEELLDGNIIGRVNHRNIDGHLNLNDKNLTIRNVLNLEQGCLIAGAGEVTIGTDVGNHGEILQSASNKRILGKLTRWFPQAVITKLFPVAGPDFQGKDVELSFTEGTASGKLTVQYFEEPVKNIAAGLPIINGDTIYNAVKTKGFWEIETPDLQGALYNISILGEGFPSADYRRLKLLKRSSQGDNWNLYVDAIRPTLGSSASPIPRLVELNSFSQFAITEGEEMAPLPVSLGSFTGKLIGGQATLNWVTVSEKDNAGFVVERSLTASGAYERLGFVKGNGTTANRNTYAFSDANAPIAAYYRLIQQDLDGKETVYGPIFLQDEVGVERSLSLWPNPVLPNTVLELKGAPVPNERVSLRIANAIGQIIWEGSDENTTILNLASEKIKSLGRGKY